MFGQERGRKWLLIGYEERRRTVTKQAGARSRGRTDLAHVLAWVAWSLRAGVLVDIQKTPFPPIKLGTMFQPRLGPMAFIRNGERSGQCACAVSEIPLGSRDCLSCGVIAGSLEPETLPNKTQSRFTIVQHEVTFLCSCAVS